MADWFERMKEGAANLAESAGKAAKGATDSAKKMSEKAKLKRKIGTLEETMERDFSAIGKLFYEQNAADPADAYVDLFTAIADTKQEIEKVNEELTLLEATMPCPSCGKPVKTEASFCSGCGAKIEKQVVKSEDDDEEAAEDDDKVTCPSCGDTVQEDAVFCPNCGMKLNRVEHIPAKDITVIE